MIGSFAEGQQPFVLMDGKGRKYLIPAGHGKTVIEGLGVIDRERLMVSRDGDVISIAGRQFSVFRATLSETMNAIRRGPQIIGEKDAALIVHFLNLGCRSTVLEIGAGSGSLTIALLHAVGDEGRVVTVERRRDHLDIARSNVQFAGLEEGWHPVLADATRFNSLPFADAVALDIPEPWTCLTTVDSSLKRGGMVASYSPTFNQLERLVSEAGDHMLAHELSFELIMRRIEVSPGRTRHSFDTLGHTGYISVLRKIK
ncbi:MAG: methyltransferase domain-containing protein [Methanomassiliicoccales archaeon]